MTAAVRKSFPLRLDPALHAAVERLAAAELRSVNTQIEFLLQEALKARGVWKASLASLNATDTPPSDNPDSNPAA